MPTASGRSEFESPSRVNDWVLMQAFDTGLLRTAGVSQAKNSQRNYGSKI